MGQAVLSLCFLESEESWGDLAGEEGGKGVSLLLGVGSVLEWWKV